MHTEIAQDLFIIAFWVVTLGAIGFGLWRWMEAE